MPSKSQTLAMLLSAVSAAALIGIAQVKKQAAPEIAFRNSIRASFAVIQQNGQPKGVAVCIDSSGLFIAQKGLATFPIVFAKLGTGRMIQLNLCATDETTQVALYQAERGTWAPGPAIKVADELEPPFDRAFALLPTGTIQVEITSADKLGIMDASRRAIPLLELKFEAPLAKVGGAPVFSKNGELIGILNATLQGDPSELQKQNRSKAATDVAIPLPLGTSGMPLQQFGPTGLTVGYALGPSALSRVVEGFLSPSRVVSFASIGVMLKNGTPAGAEITQVIEDSPADLADLRPGDVITHINGKVVRNQIDYAKWMMRQRSGVEIVLKVLRGTEPLEVKLTTRS